MWNRHRVTEGKVTSHAYSFPLGKNIVADGLFVFYLIGVKLSLCRLQYVLLLFPYTRAMSAEVRSKLVLHYSDYSLEQR
jgi:hypothetical protein